jgi:hypothetical protein
MARSRIALDGWQANTSAGLIHSLPDNGEFISNAGQ